MKLAAILACRNQSSRLYAKPLQNLDVKSAVSILDYLVAQLKMCSEINDIVLAVSDRQENAVYKSKSILYGVGYVEGDDRDVLRRLIAGAESVGADHVFRVTTESPFPFLDNLAQVYEQHQRQQLDYSGLKALPDGASYQIIRLEALKRAWKEGGQKHRSEYSTLYIMENQDQFNIVQHDVPTLLQRPKDIRLTVDWPEDLIVMREIYQGIALHPSKRLSLYEVIEFLDKNPKINTVNNWIDSGKGRAWY